ncbi:hypothetical protein SAMN02745166_01047 [Prosthecobacter debontii]|uniref:Uncharacterized protein n=1 Tax=Prosthecobacter debontii TaxID=48467 RepID=A0A1T4X508_9BACT|nr:hypothetical protein [Prosthecobacter debontii]SKA84704.1 hypothetical protein SAMN02745166_01047 [Prosthecobacter debontii]
MTHTKGDTVFSLQGEAATYIMGLNGGHLVAPLYEDAASGDSFEDDPQTWKQVFTKPPTAVFDSEIQQLLESKAQLERDLSDIRKQVKQAHKEANETLAELSKYEPLRFVKDYLDGKITHLVVVEGYSQDEVSIRPISSYEDNDAERECQEGKWMNPIRLLSLYGSKKLEWRMHRYARGYSESSCLAFPCTSEEQAIEKAHSLMAEIIAKPIHDQHLEGRIRNASLINFPVPEEFITRLKAYKLKSLEDQVSRCEQSLAEARAKMAAVVAEAKNVGLNAGGAQ